ncbi:MAG: polysaccharide deacetylase family protein, partial [Pyrinomonadaceae bacterium]
MQRSKVWSQGPWQGSGSSSLPTGSSSREGRWWARNLALFGQFFPGYRVTFLGSLIGLAYGLVYGFVGRYFFPRMYNWLVDLKEGRRQQPQWKWIFFGAAFAMALPTLTRELSALPYRQLFGEAYDHVEVSQDVVALTFDDGPHPYYTRQILDVLDRHRVKATFFIIGSNIEDFPEIAKTVYE